MVKRFLCLGASQGVPALVGHRTGSRKTLRCVCSAATASSATVRKRKELQRAKDILALEIVGTDRGGAASSDQRAGVAEAQVALEALSPGIDFDLLEGLWELIYTTAPDVAPILGLGGNAQLTSLLPLQTGKIFQRFSSLADGRVDNIIQLSVPYLLQEDQGITVRVRADYALRSASRIKLRFREAGAENLRISKLTESLLAPALLPRGWLQHRILLALAEFQVRVPLRTDERSAAAIERNAGNEYLLTYLDAETLIGRQTGSGGTFIFRRAPDTTVL